YVPGSGNRYEEVPLGIDCERCHGPGEAHVKAVESGKVVDIKTEIDWTIVNPGKLDPALQFDLCQRCHLQGTAVTTDGKSFLDFRPGMELADVLKVFQPRYADSLEQFIMASHPDRLRMSECYIQSTAAATVRDDSTASGPLTCVTCHDPHVSIESMPAGTYRSACITCHEQREIRECSADQAARQKNGDDCASCHMPISGSKDIPHVRITDHYIRVPSPVSSKEVKQQQEFVQLASLSDSRPSGEVMARGYLAHYEQFEQRPQFLDSARVFLDRALESSSETELAEPLIRLWTLSGEHGRVAALAESGSPDSLTHPWTLYRIGEAYAQMGNQRKSIDFYERAVSLAPDHLQFRTKLATAYTADQQLERAIKLFDEILRDYPKWSEAYNNRGFAYALTGDFAQAETDFRRSLELNPDFEQALGNMASLYANTGRPDEARSYLERLMEIDPDNRNYRRLYEVL
ncbi:MAG: tetratricopeptide repeat protein, partial [Rhodothermia bacterium]|nr:tetratricopeptide repeat protein [Rhodothermia bacterium]